MATDEPYVNGDGTRVAYRMVDGECVAYRVDVERGVRPGASTARPGASTGRSASGDARTGVRGGVERARRGGVKRGRREIGEDADEEIRANAYSVADGVQDALENEFGHGGGDAAGGPDD